MPHIASLRKVLPLAIFRRALGAFALVAGLTVLGSASAQATPGNPVAAIPGTSISPFAEPFLVTTGAALAAAASGGLVLHLRRRMS